MSFVSPRTLLRLRGLEKSVPHQGGRLWLLRQIDLDVGEGEFLSIVGPSGSGKTTLLNILGLFDSEFRGEYEFAGRPVGAMKSAQRQKLARDFIGYVFQQYHLLEDLTVAENLEVPLSYRELPRSERKARVADMLDRFGIVGKKGLYPSQLSGGQQQLVAVARAVIGRPAVILADEPTGALHSSQGEMIMDLFAELNAEGITVIQVTHNEVNARRGHRSIELFDGWMEAVGAA
ncbi:ABC transporter ATP-binding protein [Wenzhouxiangella sediminis]|uniref:ABC transporter ATP-binding protein n=1 Tax=Wenzhouxiangella sediminis TaxID=1792836 RepID=A0A3E1K865_9GAMM|nr:ABC transporter ATP-binding protein [Wenzhouxiangella sediminis]RFF30222.1 ABC transporter ATP-binding protein [Wenzhouxiangella sediminis]